MKFKEQLPHYCCHTVSARVSASLSRPEIKKTKSMFQVRPVVIVINNRDYM